MECLHSGRADRVHLLAPAWDATCSTLLNVQSIYEERRKKRLPLHCALPCFILSGGVHKLNLTFFLKWTAPGGARTHLVTAPDKGGIASGIGVAPGAAVLDEKRRFNSCPHHLFLPQAERGVG